MSTLRRVLGGMVGLALAAPAAAADSVTLVEKPAAGSSALYINNKLPLAPTPLVKLPIGSITPHGWLRRQLELEADGMAGHLEEISPWLKFEGNAWTDPAGQGKNGFEEVPYWLKGFGDLGYVLRDQRIIEHAKRWIDAVLASQRADGFFGPEKLRNSLDQRHPDLWPANPMLCALRSWQEQSGDPRVAPFLTRYFQWMHTLPPKQLGGSWGHYRYADYLDSVYWLYNRTGDAWLLDLAKDMHANSCDWTGSAIPRLHNVDFSQGFREPATFAQQAHDPALYNASVTQYGLMMGKWGQVPGGGFGGDENCRSGYYDPRQGFETCGIVELMHTAERLNEISGDSVWADRAEELAFNDLPAALTPDLKALHYLTAPNQVQLDKGNKSPGINNGGTMFSYSPYGVYRCCQHNFTMGWPYFAERLWHATPDGGLAATLYAASDISAKVANSADVRITETTDYPFSDAIAFKITAARGVEFPLYLRVPHWAGKASVQINGAEEIDVKAGGYVKIIRTWADGDFVTLTLPRRIGVRTWAKNNHSVSVDYGPLTFALEIGQKWTPYKSSEHASDQWQEQEVYAATPWNYGLLLDSTHPAGSVEVTTKPGPVADQPFTPQTSPISLKVKAKRISEWKQDETGLLNELRPSPVRSDNPIETVTLIPMGAARLRISAFPTISESPDAQKWTPLPVAATASHVHDALRALSDGDEPTASNDHSTARFTWWDHKGTSEWVQYALTPPQQVTSVCVYWFDDTGRGQCRVPQTWQLQYQAGADWKPVELTNNSTYAIAKDRYNRVTFKPITTCALRLVVQLQPKFSGGVLRWRTNR